MKKVITILLCFLIVVSLFGCSGEKTTAELKVLNLSPEILDISAMGMSREDFLASDGDEVDSSAATVVDAGYTTVSYYNSTVSDDENFNIHVSYSADDAVGIIDGFTVNCKVKKPEGEFSEAELIKAYNDSVAGSMEVFTEKFALTYEPYFSESAPGVMEHHEWRDENYSYTFVAGYKADSEDDKENICYITLSVTSMDFLNRY